MASKKALVKVEAVDKTVVASEQAKRDEELETVRANYPDDAVVERRFSGNIRVQLKDTPALNAQRSGAQLAGFAKGSSNG